MREGMKSAGLDPFRVGAEVLAWRGGSSPFGPVKTVTRLTRTQIILSDETRWNRQRLTKIGGHGWELRLKLYAVNDPRIVKAMRARELWRKRDSLVDTLTEHARIWVNRPNHEDNRALLLQTLDRLQEMITTDGTDTD